MSPIEILEEAIKSKSWVAAKLALKAMKDNSQPWIVQGYKESPTQTTQVGGLVSGTISTGKVNQFFDDGQTARVGDVSISPAIEDKKFKPKTIVPRNRAEYQARTLNCSVCSRSEEVDEQTYSYNMFLAKDKDEAGNTVGNQFKCSRCV